jgi:hypothetical protein
VESTVLIKAISNVVIEQSILSGKYFMALCNYKKCDG